MPPVPKVQDRYCFGLNGQEKVNEWSGVGNHLAFEERGYDSRTGRWLSIDPKFRKYPSWSPYVFAFDNPIRFYDPKGDDQPTLAEIIEAGKKSKTFVRLMKANNITDENYKEIIRVTGLSQTHPTDKSISLNVRDLNTSILSLTMEMINKANLGEIDKLQSQVAKGEIKPDEYARSILKVEARGVFNKVLVAAELGISDKELQPFIDMKRDETAFDAQIMNLIVSGSSNAIQKDSGLRAYDYYVKQGESLNANYKEDEKDKNSKQDDASKKDTNQDDKSKDSNTQPNTNGDGH